MNIKRKKIAIAVSALLATSLFALPVASYAQEPHDYDHNHDHDHLYNHDHDHDYDHEHDYDRSSSGPDPAVITDTQVGQGNYVEYSNHDNNTSVGGTAGNRATGNIGVNEAAGDNNMQDNASAIADTRFVFGGAVSSVAVGQVSGGNVVRSWSSNNNAGMSGGFANASGNIGINEVAGSGNLQKNNMAISRTASDVELADASVTTVQQSGGNNVVRTNSDNNAYLNGNALNGISGNVGVNIASGSGNEQSNSLSIARSVPPSP